MIMKGIVYKVTNKKNNKVYIGITRKSIEKRRYDHTYKSKNKINSKFYKAIATYGVDSFNWQQIDSASSLEELARKEKKFILEYDSINSGYNSDIGGGVKKIVYQFKLDGTFLKSYDSLDNAANATNAKKKNISKAALGVINSTAGYLWSYSSFIAEDRKDKRLKRVCQLTIDKTMLNVYESIAQASVVTGVNKSSIAKVCRGEQKMAGGYLWKYQ